MQFGLENVRCFAHLDPVRIAPLTLLVGENSTGKSSFLALLRIVHEMAQGHPNPTFNAAPFWLGAYEQMAYRLPGQDAAQRFRLSLSVEVPVPQQDAESKKAEATFNFHFINGGGVPHLECNSFRCLGYSAKARLSKEQKENHEVEIRIPSKPEPFHLPRDLRESYTTFPSLLRRDLRYLLLLLEDSLARQDQPEQNRAQETWKEEIRTFRSIEQSVWAHILRPPYAMAPIRSKPARTYDFVDTPPGAEGDHIPMKLARIKASDSKHWQQLRDKISDFGKKSGLLEGLNVENLGSAGAPFQLQAQIAGLTSNLIDVGYGVSQLLPILVDLLDETEVPSLYLLQQPEVHLHPRAQAELGSFLGEIVTQTPHHVVVETHSDYLLDRIRMDIREEETPLTHEDVCLLYFERSESEVQIHEIKLDCMGDILDPPPSYRNFFMAELRRKFII